MYEEYESPEGLDCPSCNIQMEYTTRQAGPNLAAYCKICERFIRNLKKLKNINKKPAKNNSGIRKAKYSRGFAFCAICNRPSTWIFERTGLHLEIHHIKENQSLDKPDDSPENTLCVCIDCHDIIHALRLISYRTVNSWVSK